MLVVLAVIAAYRVWKFIKEMLTATEQQYTDWEHCVNIGFL